MSLLMRFGLVLAFVLAFNGGGVEAVAVMSVDLGSEWMKVAVVTVREGLKWHISPYFSWISPHFSSFRLDFSLFLFDFSPEGQKDRDVQALKLCLESFSRPRGCFYVEAVLMEPNGDLELGEI